MRQARLGGEEGAVEVDRQHLLPLGERKLLERMDDLDAGVADQDVDVAERLDGGLHGRIDLGLVGDIHRHADRLAAGLLDLGCGGVGRLLVEIGDGNRRPFTREFQGDFLADAAGRAGDECNLAFES